MRDPPVMTWFRATRSMSASEVDRARSTLSADERARCDRFVFEPDRRDYAAAHALLRDVLGRHGGLARESLDFETDVYGKPFLAGPCSLQFSLAHTRGMVACALSSQGPVGVDVEAIDGDRENVSIARAYFAPSEFADLMARKDDARRARFIDLWTLKEARLKALGVGLRRPLDEVAFDFPGNSGIRATSRGRLIGGDWRFALFEPLPDFRLAVAVRNENSLRLSAREWPESEDQPDFAPFLCSA